MLLHQHHSPSLSDSGRWHYSCCQHKEPHQAFLVAWTYRTSFMYLAFRHVEILKWWKHWCSKQLLEMNRHNDTMLVVTAQLQLKTFDITSLYCSKSSFVAYYGTHHTWLRVYVWRLMLNYIIFWKLDWYATFLHHFNIYIYNISQYTRVTNAIHCIQPSKPGTYRSAHVSPEHVPHCALQAVRAPPESSDTSSADVCIHPPCSSVHSAHNVHTLNQARYIT